MRPARPWLLGSGYGKVAGSELEQDVGNQHISNGTSRNLRSPRPRATKLVGAFYVPTENKIYVASITKGPLAVTMTRSAEEAPTWFSQIKPMWDLSGLFGQKNASANYWHAKDHAYWLYENEDKGKADISNRKYPAGSIAATYRIQAGKTEAPVPLCSVGKRKVSCQAVAKGLDVSFTQPLNFEAVAQQLGDEDPYLDADFDAAFLELCEQEASSGAAPKPKREDDDKSHVSHPQAIPAIRGRFAQVKQIGATSVASEAKSTSTPTGAAKKQPSTAIKDDAAAASPSTSASACPYNATNTQLDSTPLPFTLAPNLLASSGKSGSTVLPSSTTNGRTTTTTAKSAPEPSCSMQNEDPDQGINSAYCVCDRKTLSLLSAPATAVYTESCHYTTLPPTTVSVTKALPPPTTDMAHCQICSKYTNNEDDCHSIPNCVMQTGAVTVQVGSSPVHVGKLTGDKLYTSVSSALEKLCPEATRGETACSTDSVTIGEVPYVEAGFLSEGELVVKVDSSSYNVTSLRDAMIKTAALAAKNAATGKNCYKRSYNVEIPGRCRWSRFVPRMFKRDHPYPEEESATWCNSIGFSGVNYYDPWWREQPLPGATDWIDASWSFQVGLGGDFLCSLLQDAVDAFAIVQPEFAVADIELGEALDIVCEGSLTEKRSVRNTTTSSPKSYAPRRGIRSFRV